MATAVGTRRNKNWPCDLRLLNILCACSLDGNEEKIDISDHGSLSRLPGHFFSIRLAYWGGVALLDYPCVIST